MLVVFSMFLPIDTAYDTRGVLICSGCLFCVESTTAMKYQRRFYRDFTDSDLVSFEVKIKESDLCIFAHSNLRNAAFEELCRQRTALEQYIASHPDFYLSFTPVATDKSAPEIVRIMSEASFLGDVGPMAAVAGAIAEMVGRKLLNFTPEVIVENGGDLFLHVTRPRTVMLYAGASPFSTKVGLLIDKPGTQIGIGTSSGTFGHSFSFGKADSVTVVCKSAAIADALATFFGNLVKDENDFSIISDKLKDMPFVDGVVAIVKDKMFVQGDVKLVRFDRNCGEGK